MTARPRYPIYVISKGRFENCLTAKFLTEDEVDFRLVVEPQEWDEYVKRFPRERILTLPFSNLGLGSIPARNWVWEHAKNAGFDRHWILDDNIRYVARRWKTRRFRCESGPAFAATEDFVDRYENVAIAGFNYWMFCTDRVNVPPFYLNNHVYSSLLIKNDLPNRWRGRYNEDTDLCLQVLADGWCTILMNVFLIYKLQTMTIKGGNTAELYKGDGRLKMARSLERLWPHVVDVKRRFRRPQHVVRDAWKRFDTPLKLKPGVDLSRLTPNEYGLRLVKKREIKSPLLKKFLAESQEAG